MLDRSTRWGPIRVVGGRGAGFLLLLAAEIAAQVRPWEPQPSEFWRGFFEPDQGRLIELDQWVMTRYSEGSYERVAEAVETVMGLPGSSPDKELLAMYVRYGNRWELARAMLRGLDSRGADRNTRYLILVNYRLALIYTGRTYLTLKDRCTLGHYVTAGFEGDVSCLLEAYRCLDGIEALLREPLWSASNPNGGRH